ELTANGDRVDDRADVGDERGVGDLERAGLAIELDLDGVRVRAVHVLLLVRGAGHGDRGSAALGERRLDLPRTVERGVAVHRRDAAAADARIDGRRRRIELLDANSLRREIELARNDALDHRVRAAALVGRTGLHLHGAVAA